MMSLQISCAAYNSRGAFGSISWLIEKPCSKLILSFSADLVACLLVDCVVLKLINDVVGNDSFAMVRGGHLDLAVLGAYQVAQNGDLANWSTGKGGVPAVGGAMDLVHGARQVAVVTDHTTRDGKPKLLEHCTMPLTGVGCVTRVYSSLAVVDISDGHFILREKLPQLSFDDLQAVTGARLYVDGGIGDLTPPVMA